MTHGPPDRLEIGILALNSFQNPEFVCASIQLQLASLKKFSI